MKKVKRALVDWFQKFKKPRKKSNEVLTLAIAGINRNDLIVDRQEGYVMVKADQPILIEEAGRRVPWKMYSSFGFRRSYFLPDGIHLNEVEIEICENELRFYQ